MTDPGRPVTEPVDTQRATEVLDAWLEDSPASRGYLELRGMVAAALTAARLAGYQDGYADGAADGLDS